MKNIFSRVMLVAAAAMAFFACQKQEVIVPEFEEVNGLAFSSEKPSFDDETKTHWTGETIQWSKDDNIRVAYTCDGVWQDASGNPEQGNYGKLYASDPLKETTDVATFVVPGTFKGSEQGDYKFYGIYPSTLTSSTDLSSAPSVSIDIPSEQTPAANSFDAKADVMVAQSDIYNGMPKSGEKNGSISLKWNRLVAHGHITLKSLPVDGQEVVKSIVLTADTEADMVGKHKVNFNTQEVEKDGSNATNSIAINGTNLTIDANGNVTFWACFLPCTWNSISVSVETDKATYTLERNLVELNKTKTFAKNARNVLAINMAEANRAVKNASALPFVKDFSGMTGQSEITELEGFSSIGGKVYKATGAIRLASASADGSITTQLLDLSQNFHVKVTASGWNDKELALIVSTSEPSHTETVTLTAFGGGENFAEHIINFQPVSNSASLTFTAKEDVRCYIKKIEILEGHAVAAPVLKASAPNEIAAAGGEGSFNFTLANPQDGQSVSAESNVDWITGESVSGNTVTYTVAENTSEEPREGTITLSYEGAQSVNVVIAQAGKAPEISDQEAQETLTFSDRYSANTVLKDVSVQATNFNVSFAGTGTATQYYANGTSVRAYAKNTFTVSSDKTIVKVEITFGSGDGSNAITTDVGSYQNGTWTGSAKSVTFTVGGTSGYRRIAAITVHYTDSTSGETPEPDEPETPVEPTLTPRNLAFSAATATATVGQAFTAPTLSGETTGVTYSSSNTGVATVNETTGVVTLVGAGITTIKASALATDQYEAGEASYTLTVSAAQGGGQEVMIYKESFGDNSSSARAWSDTYKEQSGISAVYSNATYTMTNLKQGKNTTGQVKSGINQSSTSSPAFFEVKNLNVSNYSNFKVSYYWKAGSIKGTYYTKLYYSTDGGITYKEVSKESGTGATSFVEVKYSLPQEVRTSSLCLKVEFSTSNTQAIIDEFKLIATN